MDRPDPGAPVGVPAVGAVGPIIVRTAMQREVASELWPRNRADEPMRRRGPLETTAVHVSRGCAMVPYVDQNIEEAIKTKYGKCFAGCEQLMKVAATLEERNSGKLILDAQHPATGGMAFFYAKANKSFRATQLLAAAGYGEDALVLARSMTSLCIDAAYVSQGDSDERARDWIAVGEVARRKIAGEQGIKLPEEPGIPWEEYQRREKRWRGLGTHGRAQAAGKLDVYNLAYRHGSSFEHSDSWSSIAYMTWGEKIVELHTAPSDALVWHALIVGAHAFGSVMIDWGRFFHMDVDAAEKRAADLFESHFKVRGDPDAALAPDVA